MWSTPYDAARVAALYAPTAVMYDKVANETMRGLEAIQAKSKAMEAVEGFEAVVTSAPIQQDRFVAHFLKFGNTAARSGRGLVVYELKDGKVQNEWVYDATSSTPVSSSTAKSDEALVADLAALAGNPYDAARVAALYAPNVVVRDLVSGKTRAGLAEFGAWIREANAQNFKIVVTSAPIRQDNFVAHFAKFGNTSVLSGRGLVVYELMDGKVLNQWVYPAP
jgi:ketosteroid isomerase-like protein